MQLTDITLIGFLCLGGIRCLSYLPQILRIARDENGASAISYTTWCTWTLANLTTASYAGFNIHDLYLTVVSCIYALCCASVIVLTAFKRAQHRSRMQVALAQAQRQQSSSASRYCEDLDEVHRSHRVGLEQYRGHGGIAGVMGR